MDTGDWKHRIVEGVEQLGFHDAEVWEVTRSGNRITVRVCDVSLPKDHPVNLTGKRLKIDEGLTLFEGVQNEEFIVQHLREFGDPNPALPPEPVEYSEMNNVLSFNLIPLTSGLFRFSFEGDCCIPYDDVLLIWNIEAQSMSILSNELSEVL